MPSVVLLVMELVTLIPSLRVMALAGLIGLKRQGHSHEPHPIVSGVVRPSRQVVFGWCVTLPVMGSMRHACMG
jgi:hypothetical protein